MPPEIRLPLAGEDDLIVARQHARALAGALGFGAVDQSRIATAVSELARNVLRYAEGSRGEVLIRTLTTGHQGIEIVVSDAGPGIADVELVMRLGYTSGRGLGLGLPGTKRLMDEMEMESAPGRGTVVTIRKWCR